MSQNITDNNFPTQKIISDVEKVNTRISVIVSSLNIDFEMIGFLSIEVEEIVALIFDSVLEGEFFRNGNIKENINQIKGSLFSSEELEKKLQNIKDESVNFALSKVREKIYLIENLLEEYIVFIKKIELPINEDKDYIFGISQNRKAIIPNKEEFSLFLINIDLCILDIQLNDSFKYVYDIDKLKFYIRTTRISGLTSQKEKMLKKADFLLFKWYKRAEVDKKNVSFVIDGDEKENYEDEVISYGEKWRNIVEYINNHYFDGAERELRKYFHQIRNKKIEDYSCQDIHFYIKYYKDVEKNLSKLDEIINFLEIKKEDKIYAIILQYAINNRFSLFLEKNSDKNKVYEEYQKVKGDYKNYFPQYKFLDKIISVVKADLQKENISLEEIKDLEYFINKKLDAEYKVYKANMEWSSQHSNFIYRVDYDECMIDDIFIYSSFVLPTSNVDAYEKYEKISSDYQILKTQIEPLKKVSSLLLDVNKNRIQIVEIMGIFLAVIAFVMSSVSGFQFVKDILSAVLFLLVFSTSLISFLLVLLLITRHNENILEKHWRKILIFYVVMLGTICCISHCIEQKNKLNTNEENKKDTLLEKIEKENLQGKDSLKMQEIQIQNK